MIRSLFAAFLVVTSGAVLWLVERIRPDRQVATAPLWPRPDGSMPSSPPRPGTTDPSRPTSFGEVWDHPDAAER